MSIYVVLYGLIWILTTYLVAVVFTRDPKINYPTGRKSSDVLIAVGLGSMWYFMLPFLASIYRGARKRRSVAREE